MNDVNALLAQLTLEEKAALCSGLDSWHLKGVARLGIPSIMVADGPHGVRKVREDTLRINDDNTVPATCFPTASALAATWDTDLLYEVGVALGAECRQEGVSILLGPGANIKRSPLCGRNFEYFSEDPYLSGKLAASHIAGVQSQGIGTSLKHYAVNNQEYRRFTVDAIVDERALHEIYLAGFEIAVQEAQPWTVMCAYNKINGLYASDHAYLMRHILKDTWGHTGFVVTDWGAMNDRIAALQAGTNLEMPATGNGNDKRIVSAVQARLLDEAILDESVARVLRVIAQAQEARDNPQPYDPAAHHALARRAAAEGAVLLKNDAALLPIKPDQTIALIGRFAKYPRYQGGGSSQVHPTRVETLHAELIKWVGDERVTYADGYTQRGDAPDAALIAEALACAAAADVVVIHAGLTDYKEIEGLDRADLELSAGHNALIEAIAAQHPHVVVVLSNGSPVTMPWANDVAAILEGYLGGQAGGGALADILVGEANPCGKLAETFPRQLADTPAFAYFPGGPTTVEYRESIYVGYRYYDTVGKEVLFPFGHGLSYTAFAYSDLHLSHTALTDADTLTVSLTVKNVGAMAGKEIVQLYVRDVESTAFRPEKELKGFAKVALEPDEARTITFDLPPRAFAHYDARSHDWVIESGDFEIVVGASSRDHRLRATLSVTSSQVPTPVDRAALAPYYDLDAPLHIPDEAFVALLGRALPRNAIPRMGAYTLNTPINDMTESPFGRQFANSLQNRAARLSAADDVTPSTLMIAASMREMPLRGFYLADRRVNREMIDSLLLLMNGKPFRAMGKFGRALTKLRRG